MSLTYHPTKPDIEQTLLNALSITEPWALLKRFNSLTRESGSEDEREAARYIISRLEARGIPYQVYQPDLFLSVPISGSVQMAGETLTARPLSFSINTPPDGISGELIYLIGTASEGSTALGGQVQFASPSGGPYDVAGKLVLIEGYGFEGAFSEFERLGAKGVIYINPGQDIHSGICTTIWGAPDLDSAPRQAKIALVAINRPDGERLKERIADHAVTVTIHTQLREGWFPCPIIVADIPGTEEPERFMLVHGHYDSWYEGIGDNAVGDATLLELARVFHDARAHLARSIKVAWWPGHSTGRYAGSTWFADHFGLELARNCIAHMDIDSPGCRWATDFYGISWMKEAEDFCVQVIEDTAGQKARGRRPLQAGDYSFNNIGVTGFFLLLSSIPEEVLAAKGYYPVGGCGGNIGWHTIHDSFELADEANLLRDLRIYATAIQRVVNNTYYPFDLRNLMVEFAETLATYAREAGSDADFSPCFDALARLTHDVNRFYDDRALLDGRSISDPAVHAFNTALLKAARVLIPINYTRNGRFRTEPAVAIPPLPDLAPAMELHAAAGHQRQVIRTHLQRGINRVAWAFEEAREVIAAGQPLVTRVEGGNQ
jgi:hypothetical protein